ncbi:MAG TPA: hypothetical protein VH596_11895 [Terriglobales bacterium]
MKVTVLVFSIFLFSGFAPRLEGQSSKKATTVAAPIPPQIAAAQKVFVSNGGGESIEALTDGLLLDGGPDRPYNEFYTAIKGWGHYDLASSPAEADIVFEVSWVFTPPNAFTNPNAKLSIGDAYPLGELKVGIIDPKTHITLWTIKESIRGALMLSNRNKNFEQAMNTVVTRVRSLVQPVANTSGAGIN